MKTALVTGASSGIGREVAKGLAREGHHVVLLSRDPERAAAALEQVRAVAAPGVAVVSVTADLSSLAGVRRAAADIKRHAERLEVLVNCAALVPVKREVTAEGFEAAFATNVLAPVVLVHELKDFLSKAAPSRVVNFYGGNEKTFDIDDLQYEKGAYDGFKAYGRTKLQVALLTIEMARRLVGAGVTVNAAWPGIVNTEGIRAMKGMMGFMMVLFRPFMRSPEAGAQTPLWLCTAPELERVSGKCFGTMRGDGRKELTLPPSAADLEMAKRLYETCERLAKYRLMKLELFADYHQVHLLDDRETANLADAWTAQATEDRLAAASGALGIGTRDAADVALDVIVEKKEPKDDSAKWQHVTVGSLEVSTGRVVLMGCTDYLPDAKRLKVAPGTYCVRVSHAGLDGKVEKLRVQLWPGAARAPKVEKRWVPPPPKPPKPVKAPKTAKAAAALARQGSPDEALAVLLALSAKGDGAAAASAAALLAFQGRWAEMVPQALLLLQNPKAVYAGNVFDDMGALINRAARELNDAGLVARAAAVVPKDMESRTQAIIIENRKATLGRAGPEAREHFVKAVADAQTGKRFQGKPDQLAQHCLALAIVYNVQDEVLARYDSASSMLTYDQVLRVARVHVRRGDAAKAWAVLEENLPRWWPMDFSQVAPVELLVDAELSPLMTAERCAWVLKTPRGAEAGK